MSRVLDFWSTMFQFGMGHTVTDQNHIQLAIHKFGETRLLYSFMIYVQDPGQLLEDGTHVEVDNMFMYLSYTVFEDGSGIQSLDAK